MNAKKRVGSVFAVLLVIVLLLIAASTVAANVMFSGDRVPKLGSYYLYLHDNADMEPDIPQNTLVVAKEAGNTSLSPGNKVLCYLADGNMALRVIYQITLNEDGSTSYYPGTAVEQGSELTIPRTNIFAICTWQSQALYNYITFAASVSGLMLLLVLPCVILIIMLLVKIARSSSEEMDEDEFLFEEEGEEEEERKPRRKKRQSPLFEPGQAPEDEETLEKKKSSISKNFATKPVNENSPYQKAVQERTMKFQAISAQQAAEIQQEEGGTQVFTPQNADVSHEPPKPAYQPKHAQDSAPLPEPAHTPEPVRSTAPNIDDIIKPTELAAARPGAKANQSIRSTDSIDDLIAALEKEKNKL